MNEDPIVIGVLGGMGTYATIHMFRQYAKEFPAEKEWERPRIIIDNNCTMPSRVRAALYGEDKNKLIKEMSESMSNLIRSGASHMILACNTSHIFLPEIYEKVPMARGRIINIIETCVDGLCDDGIDEVFLLASEGTIESGMYQEVLGARGIRCSVPQKDEYSSLRNCIEAVKQDRYTKSVEDDFLALIHRKKTCILGCTELPVLYEKYLDHCRDIRVYDPILMTLHLIKMSMKKG